MADGTKIEWTDATWNPITGCSIVSAGCTHCYAMKLAGTRMQHHHSRAGLTTMTKAGPVWNGEVRLNDRWLTQPLSWARPREIFVNAHGDTFHENAPDEWIDLIFAVALLTPQHRLQILTKRSARMNDYLARFESRSEAFGKALARIVKAAGKPKESGMEAIEDMVWPLPNVWLGVSVENQAAADERVPDLVASPAAVRWISAEPLLGPVDLRAWLPALDWGVVGGESDKGPRARPMHPNWARGLRDQFADAGKPFLFKQWGDWSPAGDHLGEDTPENLRLRDGKRAHVFADHQQMARIGKVAAGRVLDGVTHDGMPGQA
jgi:protein gp37